ncbi:MAG TPA: hypothetical protein VFC65_13130 [Prolixibacteraceae bacterium]|nr:hypothetical protein [Prolixibacteraceae bacterium]
MKKKPPYNSKIPANSVAMVCDVHLSAQASFRLDGKSPAFRPCV